MVYKDLKCNQLNDAYHMFEKMTERFGWFGLLMVVGFVCYVEFSLLSFISVSSGEVYRGLS